jgi:starvation-inducible DNA-binding protein
MNKRQTATRESTNGRVKTFSTRIDLKEETRDQMIPLLNQALGDLFDLFSQTKQAHWNVKGKDFYQLHELFDEIAEQLLEFIDIVAERVTALGGEARGTVRMAAGSSQVEEFPDGIFEGMEVVKALADRYCQVGTSVRQAIDASEAANDMSTSDLFIDISRELDKSLWFLEAHLQK